MNALRMKTSKLFLSSFVLASAVYASLALTSNSAYAGQYSCQTCNIYAQNFCSIVFNVGPRYVFCFDDPETGGSIPESHFECEGGWPELCP